MRALITAPLKVGERVIGVMALGSTVPMSYTAAELKLLSTLGLQAATAIENARLFERTVQAALERERLMALQQQTEVARAKLRERARPRRPHPGQPVPRRTAGASPATTWRPGTGRRAAAAATTTTSLPVTGAWRRDRVLFCVADVSGKGLPASLVMSNMQATLRALLGRVDVAAGPGHARQRSALRGDLTGEIRDRGAPGSRAGDRAGAVRRAPAISTTSAAPPAARWPSLHSTGLPLGLLPDGPPYTETAFVLAPGDQLLLYSDGVTEAQNDAGEEFGEERLQQVVRGASAGENAAVLADRIIAAIDAFAGATPQFDDITLMVVRRR